MLDGDTPGGEGDYQCYVGYGEIKDFPIEIQEALPVELTSFSASVEQNAVTLNWQTATEVNNYGFSVECKVQSAEWKEIGFVEGAGNSNSPKEYSFTDNLTLTHTSYSYRLKQIDIDGKFTYSKEITVDAASQPTEFALKQNYPNPFNPATKIEFSIPAESNVEIKVYNILGMEVATLLNEHKTAGTHNVEFNANALSSGIYFYKITSGNFSAIKKMTLLR
ncbi:MAG: T9SS type A sorting domain-containing protein [Ignavibacteria bacterium]|nr:T9SS type A sorting domain-containing protein [Ignavibacteria bacterium]